ncbi:MAG TPA: aldo/keto reductase [Gemmatimonadales bacterium]|nr:aldo/keto reductase [Gemmatimonadales bacterium]
MRPGARTDVGPPPRFITSEPRLGFGAWAVGGKAWGTPADQPDRTAAVERAVERGIDFFDTAPTYGDGVSEALLGRALRPYREQVAIATKVGPHDEPRQSLEASLRRLACDYVDLVQLHETPDGWEWQLEKLHKLQEEGKSLAIGLCNASHRQIAHALKIAPVVTYQGPYNLFDRDVEQRELPLCRERGLAFLGYRPLASGLLTGKYVAPPEFPEDDHRRKIYWFKGPEFERRRQVVERLRLIAADLDTSLAALALAWVLTQPGVSIVLVGARNTEQVDQNLAGVRHLTPDTLAAIDQIVADEFPPPRATERARALSASWGIRERFIIERLDGTTSYEAIAARWTDQGEQPMIAAQVKVFVDQLRDHDLIEAEG